MKASDADANAIRTCENETNSPSASGNAIKTRPKRSSKIVRPRPRVPLLRLPKGDNSPKTRLRAPLLCLRSASTPDRSISPNVSSSKSSFFGKKSRMTRPSSVECVSLSASNAKSSARKKSSGSLKSASKLMTSGMDTCFLKTISPSRARSTRSAKRTCYISGTRKRSPRTTSLLLMLISGRRVRLDIARSKPGLWTSLNSWTNTNMFSMKARRSSLSWTAHWLAKDT
ncbi:hypothetical protein BC827DRAFT_23852 [Russula dissimulans]|nr:hypothetical protein BC827DRAFT_23852 [Russula dissimulans]